MTNHQIRLPGIGNARELGGFTAGAGRIKRGRLLRTASLSAISAEDIDALCTLYKAAYIVDLRMSFERKTAPDPEVPGAKNRFLPVMEYEDFPGFEPEFLKVLADPDVDRFEMMKMAVEMGTFSDKIYVNFLTGERGKSAYRGFFDCLMSLPEGRSILWHCTDGKDRTGIASMLVLAALDVDEKTIMEDYMLTNEYNAKRIAAARAGFERMDLTPEFMEIALFGAGAVYEYYMTNALDALKKSYGSLKGYLSEELCVGTAECEALKDKFLE